MFDVVLNKRFICLGTESYLEFAFIIWLIITFFKQSAAKVNVVSPSQDIERDSVISKAFVAAGGRELVQVTMIVYHMISSSQISWLT